MLSNLDIVISPQSEFDIPDADETGLSFVENAIIKARNAARLSGLPAIADDSGLEVDALNGAPGVFSARFAGPGAGARENNAKLLKELENIPPEKRSARFHCVMVYMEHALDPTPIICQGSWEGFITNEPQGNQGFGYDPLFFVPDYHCTAAALPMDTKNELSHRGQALRALVQALQESVLN